MNFNFFKTQMSLCHFLGLQWLPAAPGLKPKPFLILPLPASQAHLLLPLIWSLGSDYPSPPQLILPHFPSASHHHIALVCFSHSPYL